MSSFVILSHFSGPIEELSLMNDWRGALTQHYQQYDIVSLTESDHVASIDVT